MMVDMSSNRGKKNMPEELYFVMVMSYYSWLPVSCTVCKYSVM